MESYKTNLENDKADLQKQLSFKESQIKYLSNELMVSIWPFTLYECSLKIYIII